MKASKYSSKNLDDSGNFVFPYRLGTPSRIIDLPPELHEVSGLSFTHDYSQLCAIQDENGLLFFLDKETGVVQKKKQFWKDGDYEGVEVTGPDQIWVVKSTSTIYEISQLDADIPQVVKHKSFLEKEYNIEGLAYDPTRKTLFLACKGKAGEGEDFKMKKAIYSFDLEKKEVNPDPDFLISKENCINCLKRSLCEMDIQNKFSKFLDQDLEDLPFNPSAIAVHPITGDIYLASSKGKMLMVLSQKGDILHLEKLEKNIHAQPEGLAFDKDGTLYVSNEGTKDKPARIYHFNMN